jgi:hypothetical protein
MAKAMGVMMDTEPAAGEKASTVAALWVKIEDPPEAGRGAGHNRCVPARRRR